MNTQSNHKRPDDLDRHPQQERPMIGDEDTLSEEDEKILDVIWGRTPAQQPKTRSKKSR